MFKTESEFEKALRIKGFAFKKDGDYFSNLIKNERNLELIEIKNISDFVSEISKLNSSPKSPLFYRGQTNANFLQIPSIMRKHINYERNFIDMFMQKFPNEFEKCNSNVDRLCLMQHFCLYTRFLDVTENPLAALYFACQPMKKFGNPNQDFDKYGEIFIYKETESEQIKFSESRTTSIISTTAFQESSFNFKVLENAYKNDTKQVAELENFIEFGDVISRSVIVKTKRNNPRIINQQGAFILCNANKLTRAKGFSENDLEHFMTYIIEHPEDRINLNPERYEGTIFEEFLKGKTSWDFNFEKIIPYDINNSSKWMQQDPFSLKRLFYKNDKNKQVIFIINPKNKKTILNELKKFNITEDFIYPDMDNVANEINSREDF